MELGENEKMGKRERETGEGRRENCPGCPSQTGT